MSHPAKDQLHPTKQQLIKSFRRHRSVYQKSHSEKSVSHLLLLFYAVECGLKSVLLDRINRNSTKSFAEHVNLKDLCNGKKGHDINRMLVYLKLSRFLIPNIKIGDGKYQISVVDLHSAWRYGIDLPKDQQELIEDKLKRICQWIDEEVS